MPTNPFTRMPPLIPAGPNFVAGLVCFVDQLGFAVTWQSETMAGVRRGSVEFNLVANADRAWADNASFAIGVDDLDALHEEYRPLTEARVGPIEVKP